MTSLMPLLRSLIGLADDFYKHGAPNGALREKVWSRDAGFNCCS